VLIHDLIDFLVIHEEERPKALRLLGEIEAGGNVREGAGQAGEGRGKYSPVFRVPP
jgi:hypothetical protein